MKAIACILTVLILTGLGGAIGHLTSGWIDYQWTLWGCAVLVFLGLVVGLGHTVIEGIVATGMFIGFNYLFIENLPKLLPILSGACAGFQFSMIVTGISAES